MIDTPELPSRLKFIFMDIVDLRKAGWKSKKNNKGLKIFDEIRKKVSPISKRSIKYYGRCFDCSRLHLYKLTMVVRSQEVANTVG